MEYRDFFRTPDSRSLLRVRQSRFKEFQVFRSRAIQRRKLAQKQYEESARDSESFHDDKSHLLLQDVEQNGGSLENGLAHASPPGYVGQTEGLQYQFSRIEGKLERLEGLYKARVSRPTFDEDNDGMEEQEIALLTKDVSQSISQCHQQVKAVQRSTAHCHGLESVIVHNLVQTLSTQLQDLVSAYRLSQDKYAKKIDAREAKSKEYFVDFNEEVNTDSFSEIPLNNPMEQRMNMQELIDLEENTRFVQEREKDIHGVVQSIVELNTIFKDLAFMVAEQGTILDRIDQNIDHTHVKVAQGLDELRKAEKHQSKNRKMKCILILAVIVIFLFLILLIKISS
ncbi:syntaxin-16-like [Tigriopus californicus]|nr:syntaxin-16-like [Tigriopus californicus]|eukprot:TCALIF_10637-PA protein Name:"Similar to Stx16 Syntaxin-16 (Mus musculus)" AED:0.05 eAED:0.05 QI:120/1/1/1/1/1/4/58/339